jgi:hypothetical protein
MRIKLFLNFIIALCLMICLSNCSKGKNQSQAEEETQDKNLQIKTDFLAKVNNECSDAMNQDESGLLYTLNEDEKKSIDDYQAVVKEKMNTADSRKEIAMAYQEVYTNAYNNLPGNSAESVLLKLLNTYKDKLPEISTEDLKEMLISISKSIIRIQYMISNSSDAITPDFLEFTDAEFKVLQHVRRGIMDELASR